MSYPHQGPPPYGQPPYHPGPPRAAPPPKSSNLLFIVLAVLGVLLVLGGGACILCVGLAAVAASDEDASTTPPSTGRDLGPTPAPPPNLPPSIPPNAPPTSATRNSGGGDTSSIDGRYECFQMRVIVGPNFSVNTQWVPGALPGFTIASGSYTSSGGGGSVSVAASIVSFEDGAYAGWRGTTSTNSTGFFILFRGKDHANPQPGVGAKSGDYQCYRQK